MRICVIESPYKANTEFELQRNLAYARALVEHVTLRGDSPVASHLLITQSLDDRDPVQRAAGITAGLALLRVADVHAFGVDIGVSDGMRGAMAKAKESVDWGKLYEEISLPEWAEAMADTRANPVGAWIPLNELVRRYAPKWHVHW